MRGFNLATELDDLELAATEAQEPARKDYRRHRSLRTAKRSSLRMGNSKPAIGIAGRRNRRWSW
jgi:hypothetical protein